jgi:hypothetical protein
VPRIAVQNSTFDDLLWYPAVAGRTVFIMNIGKAASKSGNLLYTFGTGTRTGACPFLPYWKAFMAELQAKLIGGTPERDVEACT